MAFHLRPREAISEGLLRIILEEIDLARNSLQDSAIPRDTAIHETRKALKRLRAVLRLFRPAYVREAALLRNAGLKLSAFRDADVLLQTVHYLQQHADPKHSRRYNAVRKQLAAGQAAQDPASAQLQVGRTLTKLADAAAAWKLSNELVAGIQSSYRRGRKALKTARDSNETAAWHELRKRVKDHWYQMRLVKKRAGKGLKKRLAGLEELEALLGTDHDIAVLEERIAKLPGAAEQHKKLRDQALPIAEKLYAGKPRAFMRELGL